MTLKFAYLCQLFQQLEALESKARDTPAFAVDKGILYSTIVEQWFRDYRKIIDAPSTSRASLLSSLFPERRTDRVYWLQPKSLLNVLCRCLGYGAARLQRLRAWDPSSEKNLVSWVVDIVKPTDPGMPPSNLNVEDIDEVLDRVAARCRFSSPQIRKKFRESADDPVHVLLGRCINRMPSQELKWFLHLILKSLHTIVLDEGLILRQVHFMLPALLRFQSTFLAADECLKTTPLRSLPSQIPAAKQAIVMKHLKKGLLKPQLGVKIGRPNFVKARSLEHCINLAGNRRWVVQRKYDGEYCQVHVDLDHGSESIKIFAKSGKDATLDRTGAHSWLRRCLRLGTDECAFKKACILEGELVVYDRKRKRIAPFHKIRKYVTRSGSSIGTGRDSPRKSHEQLILLFYDVLLVDEDVVLEQPYIVRKDRLRNLVAYFDSPIDGIDHIDDFELGIVDLRNSSLRQARSELQTLFAHEIAMQAEGLVLKPCDEPYFSLANSEQFNGFIKLKKDVIPGLGDTADLAIVGVRRDTSKPFSESVTWNCFIVACIENKTEICRFSSKPIVKVLDVVCRPCISKEDMIYLSNIASFSRTSLQELQQYGEYDVQKSRVVKTTDMFLKEPIIIEVFGTGFDKPSGDDFYMLRYPRIRKIHFDREYEDVLSFAELQEMAKNSLERSPELALEEDLWLQRIEQEVRAKRSAYVASESPYFRRKSNSSSNAMTPSPRKRHMAKFSPKMVEIDSTQLLRQDSQLGCIVQDQPRVTQSSSSTPVVHQSKGGKAVTANDQQVVSSARSLTITNDNKKENRSSKGKKRGLVDDLQNPTMTKKARPLVEVSNVSFQRNGSDRASLPRVLGATSQEISVDSAQSRQIKVVETELSSKRKVTYSERPSSGSTQRSSTALGLEAPRCRQCDRPLVHVRLPVFLFSTIYISTGLRFSPYCVEDLLSGLSPAHTTIDLSHWAREISESGPFASVVGESQAFPGLQKVVLVEHRQTRQTEEVIKLVRELKLCDGEVIDVWDWRLVEAFHRVANHTHEDSPERSSKTSAYHEEQIVEEFERRASEIYLSVKQKDTLCQMIAEMYLGKVAFNPEQGNNDWFLALPEEKLKVANNLVEQAFT